MSRLDAEYDPAEHHDLDRIETHPIVPIPSDPRFTPICACGWSCSSCDTRDDAYKAWDQHRMQEWFG